MTPSHGAIPPGGTLRLAVGEPDGPRSQTWKIFTSRNWPDVYIGPRASMDSVKLSLHAETWRLAVTKPGMRRAGLSPDMDRVLARWEPTDAIFTSADWRPAAMIVVPPDALSEPMPEKRVPGDEPIRFSPAAGPGMDRVFILMLGAPGAPHLTLVSDADGGRLDIVGGGQLAVWVTEAPSEPAFAEEAQALRERWSNDLKLPLPAPGFAHTTTKDQRVPVLIDVGMVYRGQDETPDPPP